MCVCVYNSGQYSQSCVFLSAEKVVIAKSNILLDVKPWDDETGVCVSVKFIIYSFIVSKFFSLCPKKLYKKQV